MNKFHAEYDKSAITPSVDTAAVGRVGGSDDETFSREDGAEARAEALRRASDGQHPDESASPPAQS